VREERSAPTCEAGPWIVIRGMRPSLPCDDDEGPWAIAP
jgi:hypothetical protein